MRFRPLARREAPEVENEPMYVSPRHFMRSSSMPPAVVTIAEMCLCWAR